MFNQMLEHSHKHPGKPKSVEEWILKGSNYHKPSCASATFDGLVKLGLVGKKPKLWGTCMKFPTLNPGPQNELVKEIQMIALAGHATDGFTWTLLKLARFADSLFYGGAPILKHHFRKEEYDDAKKKIKELVDTKKQDTKGISGQEEKDLQFDNLCEIETFS